MYLWLKRIHVLAVAMFVGNMVTGVFWHEHAMKTRDPRLLAHMMDGVIRSDRLFTMPGQRDFWEFIAIATPMPGFALMVLKPVF